MLPRKSMALSKHKRLFVLAVCIACQSTPCAGQVYKWVDEKGVTQYSEKPPPGTKAQAVKTPPPKSVAEDKEKDKDKGKSEATTWQQKEAAFQKRQIEAEEQRKKLEAEENKARRQAALKRERCIEAQRDVITLKEKRPVYEIDERGDRRYFGDKERAETIKKAQEFIEKNCPK